MATETEKQESDLIRVVAAVIVSRNRKQVLVGQRSEGSSHPLKWEFVGGKVEPGESPEEALSREVDEETGLKVTVGRLIDIVDADYRGFDRPSHRVSFYECQRLNGVAKIDPEIYSDLKWMDIEELPTLDWIEANREFAQKLAISLTTPARSDN